jgi:hypothetical protein
MHVGGAILVLGACTLVLLSPVIWPWRIACALAVGLFGIASWQGYLRRRPANLTIAPGGGLWCTLPDGGRYEVMRIHPGVIRPWLVSARLALDAGPRCNLFVPGWILTAQAHWQLRRAILGFRPPRPDIGGGPDQSGDRRGT